VLPATAAVAANIKSSNEDQGFLFVLFNEK